MLQENDTEDIRLIREFSEGRRESFEKIFEKHSTKIKFFAKKFSSMYQLYNIEEDIVQRTFMIFYKNPTKFNVKLSTSFQSWLLGVAKKEIQKDAKKYGSFVSIENLEREALKKLNDMMRYMPNLDENYDEKTKRKQLIDAINMLPPLFKETVELYKDLDLSMNELADVLEVPEGTAKSRINRTIKYLRRIIGKDKK
ncbi:MAG: sigma-70 family RNA polymerase sigma factor [Blastocatellia bacterium]